ncbi:efflux RND transporter periplasmic adaptor subunit [Thalassobius sp. Cn5-15]|uniref:efflux RND transporter periplasmic adaptor subunit n=1 Tax=Thalassobius sp. Cn5-15 TaxID=2917763 RepID=UPI001EF196B8|nr:efflux RND transporter periplasmic adaptor subunit [Thalassobius sp. Cn5-15]MCG7495048.1 efflux RND transporter periplasmic adaptor subunit [Thalassobius sp. Cn5-15]
MNILPTVAPRLGAAFVLTAALSGFVALAGAAMAQEDSPAEIIRPVKLLTVENTSGDITRQFFGQVVARQTVDLAFQVGGQIVEFPVIEGQIVPKGGLIAKLDQEPFTLQLDQTSLQYDQAKRTLDRLSKLTGSAVSEVVVQDTETQVGLARIARRNAEYALEHATLSAPFDALVATRNVANFTTVGAGTPIVRLHDMSDLRIEIDVPEVLFQRAGSDTAVTLMARFPTGDTLYPLAIREYVAEASTIGQTFQLTLGLERPDGLTVLPGSSVTVLATVAQDGGAVILPATAIDIANDGSTQVMVFTLSDNEDEAAAGIGRVSARAVEVTTTRDGKIALVSGLETGEVIVRSGLPSLNDGQRVRRFIGFPD